MQQNQDNLTDENPYESPKSTDFKVSENNVKDYFQHTKKQIIYRVIFAGVFLPICYALLYLLFLYLWHSWGFDVYDNDTVKENETIMTHLKGILGIISSWFVQGFIFFLFIEKIYFYKRKETIYLFSLLGSLFLSVSSVLLLMIFFGKQMIIVASGIIILSITLYIPILITIFLLIAHTAYCQAKLIQAA